MTGLRELVHLGFRCYEPHPELKSWVQCYWSTDFAGRPHRFEHVYPDGGSSLIFDLAAQDLHGVTFVAHQAPQMMIVPGHLFGIRFRPTGAYQLLGLPIKELAGEVLSQAPVLVPGLAELCERMMAEAVFERLKLVDEWLFSRLRHLSSRTGFAERLPACLSSHPGRLQELISELGVSRRTAERRLKEFTGSTFSQLQAWSRVKQARRLIKLNQSSSLTDIGLSCGYYDQSHFIREFRRVTTFTPMDYRKRQRMRVKNGETEINQGGQTCR